MKPRPRTLAGPFPTTQWSNVLIAQQDSQAGEALNQLCVRYWRPVYSFARHRGMPSQDAEDVTQAFFARILESGYLQNADQNKGKFRTFLIHHFRFFLSNYKRKAQAEKRGGKHIHIPLDVEWAESNLELSDPRFSDPDLYFDRQWALEILRHARGSVAEQYALKRKSELFESLQPGLASTPDNSQYECWSKDLNMSKGALRVALHRMRERFREAIEDQIRSTISDETSLKQEMHHLRKALGNSMTSD